MRKNQRTGIVTGIVGVLALVLAFGSAQGAVLTDPTMATGSGAFDPTGSQDVDVTATGAASMAALEAIPGFGVVYDWTGLNAGKTSYRSSSPKYAHHYNYLDFSDTSKADVSFEAQSSWALTSNVEASSTSYSTSGSSHLKFNDDESASVGSPRTLNFEIQFGTFTYDHSADGYTDNNALADSLNNDKTARAAGFVITGLLSGASATVTFYGADDATVLSQQTVSGDNTLKDAFFGYDTGATVPADGISKIRVSITRTSSAHKYFGLDDFGFVTVPEPATMCLLAVGGAACLFRRKK